MATNETFDKLIQDLTKDITVQVHAQVHSAIAGMVQTTIREMVNTETIKAAVTDCVNRNIDQYRPDMSLFDARIKSASDAVTNSFNDRADRLVIDLVNQHVTNADIPNMIQRQVLSQISGRPGNTVFPDGSIPGSALDIASVRLSGDNVSGGVIKKFSSVGIDDQASSCKLTIMDQGVVFENTLYAPKMEVRGDCVVDGALVIRGGMDSNSEAFKSIVDQTVSIVAHNTTLLDSHQNRVFERIRTEGIEIGKLIVDGREIIEGRSLTTAIINSHLETVGVLRDLQTQGETLLSEALYTANRRVGINTMDPATALSVWDEEVEFGIGKQQKDVGRIATRREHTLVLGSNGHDNIKLSPDGLVLVDKIRIGNMTFGSSPSAPSYSAPRGTVIFNENPNVGGPMGWVSLGDARWANFGIID